MGFKEDYLNSELTWIDIATRNNIPKWSIPRLIKKYNLPKVNRRNNTVKSITQTLTKISELDKIDIIKLYEIEKMTIKKIASKYDVSDSCIRLVLKKNNIKVERKCKIIANHDYFKNLTPKKARMLGLLATDGDIRQIKGGNYRIRFSSKDIELIDFVIEELGGTYYKEQGNFRTYVMSKEIGEDLKLFGITQYKSYSLNIRFDLIPKELHIYFLIGTIEGNGYVSKIYPGQKPYINVCTASEIFANQLLDNFSEYFKYIYTKNTDKSNYLSILYYPQTTQIDKTLALAEAIISKSKDCGILSRKLERLIAIKNTCKI
jgi:hypothetical protein